jgi:5-methylcytosine-specific restriction endonuclease McrA
MTSNAYKWTFVKKRYMKWYEETYEYVHCLNEECDSPNDAPHSIHHIVSRSKKPRHPMLHDLLNLIMLCKTCHDKFHHGKTKDDYKEAKRLTRKWKDERGLHKLFGVSR